MRAIDWLLQPLLGTSSRRETAQLANIVDRSGRRLLDYLGASSCAFSWRRFLANSPLNLDEVDEWSGIWWLPDDPAHPIPGAVSNLTGGWKRLTDGSA